MIPLGSAAEAGQVLGHKAQLAARLAAEPALGARLKELRAWQAARLERTYADQRADPRTARAMEFFLSDLYGPRDFTQRDADLARAWGVLRRTLPRSALQALLLAIELDALSEELDLAVAERLPAGPVTAESYAHAYREVGRPEARRRQIALILDIGERLDRAVRTPFVGLALRAARAPARFMGFGALQDFIERGFAAFADMPSAAPLLETIGEREGAFMTSLFAQARPAPAAAIDNGGV